MKKLKNIEENQIAKTIMQELKLQPSQISIRAEEGKIISLITGEIIAKYNCFKEILTII